jgi:hypothetical protein
LDILSGFPDESFDLAFLDADKEDYCLHYEDTLPKIRKGGFILVDNTLWYGKVIEEVKSNDWATRAILDFNRKLADDDRVEKVILPLRDGLTLIRKNDNSMDTNRQQKVNRLIQRELSEIFLLDAKKMQGILISVTNVRVSPEPGYRSCLSECVSVGESRRAG